MSTAAAGRSYPRYGSLIGVMLRRRRPPIPNPSAQQSPRKATAHGMAAAMLAAPSTRCAAPGSGQLYVRALVLPQQHASDALGQPSKRRRYTGACDAVRRACEQRLRCTNPGAVESKAKSKLAKLGT